ncbi:hypothetical protein HOH87_08245 [bacterium]|jgi:perosamine synthetase|nr:hypothetical protein [bacterium]
MNAFEFYKKSLQNTLGTDTQMSFFWKGRVALYAILKALDIGPGDEVVLPGYTCIVVPNAILYTGAKPVYCDIDPATFNADTASIVASITPNTKAIIIQNTYGLSSDVKEIVATARARGIITIEDCTHGFGATTDGQPNGTVADVSFFSTQWNKPFSTGIGGFSVTQDPVLADKIQGQWDQCVSPSFKESLMLRLLVFVRKWMVCDWNYWPMVRFYRLLSYSNIVLGSSQSSELEGITMPFGFMKKLSKAQAKQGVSSCEPIHKIIEKRRLVAKTYTDFLKSKSKNHVAQELHTEHGFLKYPLLVSNRESFMKAAASAKVRLGEWFLSPLHPIEGDLGKWGFDTQKCPNSVRAAKHMVNLPTDTAKVDRVLQFLEAQIDDIL